MSETCALVAAGAVSALGATLPAMWPRLLEGDTGGLSIRGDLVAGRELVVADVASELPDLPASLARYACRNNALLLAAYAPLARDFERVLGSCDPSRIGIAIGTSTSGSAEGEAAIYQCYDRGALPEEFDYAQLEFGGPAEFLAARLGVTGPAYAISTACSSSARALVSGRAMLHAGLCDAVLAGGADSLCGLTTYGFSALQAVAPEVSNPFSENRNGLTLGEGAALFLMTRESGGIQLLGVGDSCEAHHMSAPDPEGVGAESCMRKALADASLQPADIDYLNLHGTGTQLNDAMEAKAVDRIFEDVPCSSTKPLVGHTLGAAGAMEAAFCWLALSEAADGDLRVPVHRYDGAYDENLPRLNLIRENSSLPRSGRAALMSNSFGFGGNNCSLVLGHAT